MNNKFNYIILIRKKKLFKKCESQQDVRQSTKQTIVCFQKASAWTVAEQSNKKNLCVRSEKAKGFIEIITIGIP